MSEKRTAQDREDRDYAAGGVWIRYRDRHDFTSLGIIRYRNRSAVVMSNDRELVAIRPADVSKEFTPT